MTRYIDRTDTLYKTIAVYVPKPIHVRRSQSPTEVSSGLSDFSSCGLDTSLYSDSLYRAHEFKAVITDTVLGRILGRSVQWADLSPIEQRVVTNTITVEKHQPLIKVYLGAGATVPVINAQLSRFDIAPGLSFIFADRYMGSIDYGIFGEQIHASLKVKLSFRK